MITNDKKTIVTYAIVNNKLLFIWAITDSVSHVANRLGSSFFFYEYFYVTFFRSLSFEVGFTVYTQIRKPSHLRTLFAQSFVREKCLVFRSN